MKQTLTFLAAFFIFTGCKNEEKKESDKAPQEIAEMTEKDSSQQTDSSSVEIDPISHATAVVKWDESVFYIDPTGGAEAFADKPKPDFVLITDIHGDHMDANTLNALKLGDTKVIVPKAVKEKLPKELQKNLVVMNNGETKNHLGFEIEALPMYNLPESQDAYHTKGRGNGYVISKGGTKVYFAGDTEDIPEMRNLKNIDMAFIPMNLPYTMPVEQAAEGVLAFAPAKVYPYHYRGKDGLHDVEKFKKLVNEGNKNIEVVLLDWYPDMD
ncbi:MBL fold metallo-hydrolase [Salegentibacter chungangensis]|uniref:MBL fold metallo-hydrolase n=1 Tax=Salegentibacter chungangensis TaxID=1335724 RepID=A0ABW3NSL3_9FLAO